MLCPSVLVKSMKKSKPKTLRWYEWLPRFRACIPPSKSKYYLKPSFEGGKKWWGRKWSKSRSSPRRFVDNTRCGRGEKVTLSKIEWFTRTTNKRFIQLKSCGPQSLALITDQGKYLESLCLGWVLPIFTCQLLQKPVQKTSSQTYKKNNIVQ